MWAGTAAGQSLCKATAGCELEWCEQSLGGRRENPGNREMRDVSPHDTAHVIDNYTNSFACAFHRATAGVTFPNAPGSLNSGVNCPSGSFPHRKVSFLSSSPRLGPVWERVEAQYEIIWSDIALGCGFGEMFVPALSTSTSCSAQGATCVVIKLKMGLFYQILAIPLSSRAAK